MGHQYIAIILIILGIIIKATEKYIMIIIIIAKTTNMYCNMNYEYMLLNGTAWDQG